jgi:hypothetical protein
MTGTPEGDGTIVLANCVVTPLDTDSHYGESV